MELTIVAVGSSRTHRKSPFAPMTVICCVFLIVCRGWVLFKYCFTFNCSILMYEPSAHFCIKEKLLSDFHQMSSNVYLFYFEVCNQQEKDNDVYLRR